MRGIEGEQFAVRFGNPPEFVVFEMRSSASLIGRVGQVTGTVVAVAAFDRSLAIARCDFGFAFAAFRQVVEGGDLFFQTT